MVGPLEQGAGRRLTVATAPDTSNGLTATSPASATWWTDHGSTSRNGWYGRSSLLPARIAAGPNRAPGR